MTTLRLAHRGDWRAAPENSLAAMAAALALPRCDGLEFDVRSSRDGVPVVLHDPSLRRVQGIAADVADLAAVELAGHGIPSLAAVLALAGPEPFLDVELKGEPAPAVVHVLEAARGQALERAAVSSFEPPTLAWLGRERPGWPRWLNALDLGPLTVAVATDAGCSAVAVAWTAIDGAGLDRARRAGLDVAAWTVRELATYERLAGLGVIAICAEADALDG
ncbi:MAG TPA: glycerophosphodiester phosphodiesterase [Candidatus Limnocylindrales bacterium]|nr:glycerophosphodiester phosphodiesterase [Candidatus Limnocylindrales bacterium]